MTVPQYSIRTLLLPSRFQFPVLWMLSCNNNIFITSPTVIILLPSDITHCSNEGYYRSDKYVCILHLLNVPLIQLLFTNTNSVVQKLNLSLPSLFPFSFRISSEPHLPVSWEKYTEDASVVFYNLVCDEYLIIFDFYDGCL